MRKEKKILLLVSILVLLFCYFFITKEKKVNDNKELKNLTLVLDWVPNTNHTGIFVAKEKGYFEEEGINLEIVQPSEDSSASIVGSGKAEFGIYFQPNMVKRLLKNVPITAVAAILQHNTAGIMTNQNVDNPTQLSGKKYLSWEDAIDDATVKELVQGDVVMVPGETTDPIVGLNEGLFDYLIVYYGWDGIRAKMQNQDYKFFFFKDYNPNLDYFSPVIIANNDFLNNNKELAKKALNAISKGYEFAAKNPEEAAQILIKNAPETDKDLVIESQKWLSTQYIEDGKKWGIIDIDRWDNFFNYLYEKGLIDTKLEKSAGATNEFIK